MDAARRLCASLPVVHASPPSRNHTNTHRDVPKLVLADMRGGAMKRFLYEGDVKNSGKMGKFIGEFFDGKLKVCALAVIDELVLVMDGWWTGRASCCHCL